MKTFYITQLHTFEHVYRVLANSEEEAIAKLQANTDFPMSDEWHSMNDPSDWTVEESHT